MKENRFSAAGSGLGYRDYLGTSWQKHYGGYWRRDNDGAVWSSDDMFSTFGYGGNFVTADPEDEIEESASTVDKKTLREHLESYPYGGDGATLLKRDLISFFDLDDEQDMLITIKIQVKNLDPMGDTFTFGVEALTSAMEDGLVNDIVQTVDIVPRGK